MTSNADAEPNSGQGWCRYCTHGCSLVALSESLRRAKADSTSFGARSRSVKCNSPIGTYSRYTMVAAASSCFDNEVGNLQGMADASATIRFYISLHYASLR